MSKVEPKKLTVSGKEIFVRAAHADDAEAVVEYRRRVVGTSPFFVGELQDVPSADKLRMTFAEQAQDDSSLTLVVEVCDTPGDGFPPASIVGLLSFKSGNRRKIAHQGTFGLGVDSNWRGKGVGTALIEVMLDWTAAHPLIEKVGLGVFATNERARRLYERLGFVEEARQVNFVKEGPGEYIDDIMMCIFVKEGVAPEGFGVWTPGQQLSSR